jgi:enoyl-CoA hydratase
MRSTSEYITNIVPGLETVIIGRQGSLGRIRLNRPKALNSLTLEMVRVIGQALDDFEHDPLVAAVLLTGEGERGLCAGGDIRAMWDSGKAKDGLAEAFWREEYHLNARINRHTKPYVAFMDGIVMGGGVGLSVYACHRVVTERTRFAMPETGIGFFPDIGASWFLTRQPGELGTYIALTGEMLGAGDVVAADLADIHVLSDHLPDLIDALASLPPGVSRAQISSVISGFSDAPQQGKLSRERAAIDRLFASDRIWDILAALEHDGSEFARKTAATLRTKSPLSLNVTLRLLRLGRRTRALEDCLEREFAATHAVLESRDFYEGVRAAVIDKDRNPQWRPASLADVTTDQVAAYFPATHQKLFAD